MSVTFSESVVEDAALARFETHGWSVSHGNEIAPGEPGAERADYRETILAGRLRAALARLNPGPPAKAFRKLTRLDAPTLLVRNRSTPWMLVDGVTAGLRQFSSTAGARSC